MHPILALRARLIRYLLAWLPIAALAVVATRESPAVGWRDAAATVGPAFLLFAFVCLSPFYICRAIPLRLSNISTVAFTFAAAAAAAGAVLSGSALALALTLQKTPPRGPALFGAGALLYLVSAGVHYAALASEASRAAERREAEARTLAREAELQALRTQINPHFLFNSLHSISALATSDGKRAREMCLRLADFLRASLGLGDRASIPLAEELALAQSYLEVERIRFGERMRVESEVESGCEECGVPALLLQPLVENAVKHGIANLLEGGEIRLAAHRNGPDVAITLENAFDPETPARRGLGLGLAQVRRRLEVRYGNDAVFEAGPRGEVFRVALRFPCEG
jgi:signal transduction histidine kinase